MSWRRRITPRLCVFHSKKGWIDYRDIHKEVGSILICVNEKVLQKAMERISGEVYYLEQDGRVLSAPDDTLIGASIGCDEFWYIGNKKIPGLCGGLRRK